MAYLLIGFPLLMGLVTLLAPSDRWRPWLLPLGATVHLGLAMWAIFPPAGAPPVSGLGGWLLLATPSGPGLLLVAGFGLAVGYAYDLVAKGTAWSWLPFALGLPLLPLFGWYGATGGLPAAWANSCAPPASPNARSTVQHARTASSW